MDTKNVIAAISLSAAVIILYSLSIPSRYLYLLFIISSFDLFYCFCFLCFNAFSCSAHGEVPFYFPIRLMTVMISSSFSSMAASLSCSSASATQCLSCRQSFHPACHLAHIPCGQFWRERGQSTTDRGHQRPNKEVQRAHERQVELQERARAMTIAHTAGDQ